MLLSMLIIPPFNYLCVLRKISILSIKQNYNYIGLPRAKGRPRTRTGSASTRAKPMVLPGPTVRTGSPKGHRFKAATGPKVVDKGPLCWAKELARGRGRPPGGRVAAAPIRGRSCGRVSWLVAPVAAGRDGPMRTELLGGRGTKILGGREMCPLWRLTGRHLVAGRRSRGRWCRKDGNAAETFGAKCGALPKFLTGRGATSPLLEFVGCLNFLFLGINLVLFADPRSTRITGIKPDSVSRVDELFGKKVYAVKTGQRYF